MLQSSHFGHTTIFHSRMKSIALIYFLFSILNLGRIESATANVKIRQNGYSDILVAISEDVPYDATIIPQIQVFFNLTNLNIQNCYSIQFIGNSQSLPKLPASSTKQPTNEPITKVFKS